MRTRHGGRALRGVLVLLLLTQACVRRIPAPSAPAQLQQEKEIYLTLRSGEVRHLYYPVWGKAYVVGISRGAGWLSEPRLVKIRVTDIESVEVVRLDRKRTRLLLSLLMALVLAGASHGLVADTN